MPLRSRALCRLVLAFATAAALGATPPAAPFAAPPHVERLCYDCHGDGMDKGSFAIDDLLAAGADANHHGQWLKVWKNVRHEFMPPADGDPMTAPERRELAQWIEQNIFRIDPKRPDPGSVTIRRLNREEYQHTVNDLFGTDFELRDQLLPDDSAHGFDNIADAQTFSPVQFVRYLDLAEWIVGQIVVDTGPPLPRTTFNVARKSLRAKDGRIQNEFPVELAHDGRYRFEARVEIGGWQDYGGDTRLSFDLGAQRIGEQTVPFGGEVDETFTWEFTAKKGTHPLAFLATLEPKPVAETEAAAVEANPAEPQPRGPVDPERAARIAEMRRLFEEEFGPPPAGQPRGNGNAPPELKFQKLVLSVIGPLDAGVTAEYPAPHRNVFFRGAAPADESGRRTYASEILRRIADRAFHRPVDEPALAGLVDLALQDENFERGIGSALTAILSSPRFLFREELRPETEVAARAHPIDDFALASRLSYLLWLSIPDDELNTLAAAGKLRANLASQVQRMLADRKSERFFRDFSGQWLRTRNVLMTAITPTSVADRLNPVRKAMKDETDLFFEHVARSDRDLIELLTADYTFLNEALAKFYDIPGITGEEMRLVKLPPETRRGGVLTHGSILVSTSNPNRTSPVKRGVFVLENILGTPPPPPPAAVPDLEEAKRNVGDAQTLRAQLAAHRADRACAACHAHFDPIGLALENFSYVGRWREKERGEPIDASGEMVTGETFSTFAEMRGLLANRKDKFYRCVVEKLMTYALGRGLEPFDAPTVDAITDRLLQEGGKFSTLLMAVIESPAFQMRRADPVALRVSAGTGHPRTAQ